MRDPNLLEMHGVPRDIVTLDLKQCGARLVDCRPDDSAGPEWKSWRYAVTKA